MSEETLTTGQPKIIGYRNLSEAEIALMNDIKALGVTIEAHIGYVNDHLIRQRAAAMNLSTSGEQEEMDRLRRAGPSRWLSIAQTDFQTGLMALTRSVAQPSSF